MLQRRGEQHATDNSKANKVTLMDPLIVLPQEVTTDGFEWTSDSDDAIGSTVFFSFAGYFVVTEIQLQFPVGDTYKFDLSVSGGGDSTVITVSEKGFQLGFERRLDRRRRLAHNIHLRSELTLQSRLPFCFRRNHWQDLESVDTAGFQSFDLTSFIGQYATSIGVIMRGTGSGAPGFKLLDGRILGTQIDNPTSTFYVSAFAREEGKPALASLLESWRIGSGDLRRSFFGVAK